MIPRRLAARAGLAAAIIAAATAIALTAGPETNRGPAGDRPRLLLLTSLPILFGEQFSLQNNGSPALKVLQSRYRVVPISVADPAALGRGNLLLMAQPQAQPAEDLVALDHWVRRGGRVLLLADPLLEWRSERPLGDPLRPPPLFADTGLLSHWGLRLQAPDRREPQVRRIGGENVLTLSPGSLSGGCSISQDRAVARCRIGHGRATIVADADFLHADRLGVQGAKNLDGLLGELATLGRT
jgi:hypothetical protein